MPGDLRPDRARRARHAAGGSPGWRAVLAAFLLVPAFFLGGCGGSETIAVATDAATATPAASGRIELTLFHSQGKSISAVIEDSIARFEEAHPNVDVTVESTLNDASKNRLASAAATNNLPDIFPTWTGGTLREFVQMGRVLDLKPYLDESGDVGRFQDKAIAQATIDDGIWAIPVDNVVMAVVFYNRTLFAELGLRPPTDWQELIDLVDALNASGVTPFALANRSGWPASMYHMYLVDRIAGPTLFEDAMNRRGSVRFDDPAFLQAWTYFGELLAHKAFPENANLLDEDIGDSRQLLYDRKAAMCLIGSWITVEVSNENPKFLDDLDFFIFPTVPDGKGDPADMVGTVGDQFYSVSNRCANPREAYELIRFLIDDSAVEQRVRANVIPPVKGIQPVLPVLRRVNDLAAGAPAIQFWYDQSLPPRLAEVHKQICRDVIEGLTPEEACGRMESAASAYFAAGAP